MEPLEPLNLRFRDCMRRTVGLMTIVGMSACVSSGSGGIGSVSCGFSGPAPTTPKAPVSADRKYLLERVDEAAVVQVYADGFHELSLKDKTLVWHLYQAAIAGRDIFYDQRYAHNLERRDILEAIVSHADGVDAA